MKKKFFFGILLALLVWIGIDLGYPFQTDIRQFDPKSLAHLDKEMWRSYYERKPFTLFLQSAKLMRQQYEAPLLRSHVMAYHAAKAAFVFKDGKSRPDYEKALPNLNEYFSLINDMSNVKFDVKEASRLELEWWIIRRYRQQHPPVEWEQILSEAAATIYHLPAEKFKNYAHLRTEAMLLRDSKGEKITETDWLRIDQLLHQAWMAFYDVVRV